MRTRGEAARVPWAFPAEVDLPEAWRPFLWDHPDGRAPLEKVLARVLERGRFEDLRELYARYPDETASAAARYPVRRGVRYWIERWRGSAP